MRVSRARRSARLAWDRAVDDCASAKRDSVLHFDDANPDQPAKSATVARRIASMMLMRSARASARASARCSEISLPTSAAESPSPTSAASYESHPLGMRTRPHPHG